MSNIGGMDIHVHINSGVHSGVIVLTDLSLGIH